MSSYLHTQPGRHGDKAAGQPGRCEEEEGVPEQRRAEDLGGRGRLAELSSDWLRAVSHLRRLSSSFRTS